MKDLYMLLLIYNLRDTAFKRELLLSLQISSLSINIHQYDDAWKCVQPYNNVLVPKQPDEVFCLAEKGH